MCVAMLKNVRIVNARWKGITNGIISVRRNLSNAATNQIAKPRASGHCFPPRICFYPVQDTSHEVYNIKAISKQSFAWPVMSIRYSTNAPSLYSCFTLCPGK
jgi:hypothetical protein